MIISKILRVLVVYKNKIRDNGKKIDPEIYNTYANLSLWYMKI